MTPAIDYSALAEDVDETAMGVLAALAEVRSRLAAHYASTPDMAETVVGIVDRYAVEVHEDASS